MTTKPRLWLPSPFKIDPEGSPVVIYRNYGEMRHDKKGWYAHTGIDVPMPIGQALKTVAESEIVGVWRRETGWGNRVECRINTGPFKGFRYAFCHCSALLVGPGEKVPANHLIALSGNSGNSTGPHLHLMCGVNLGWNGYALSPDETSLIGFMDPFSLFDFTGAFIQTLQREAVL